eukprot:768111-Hanusia_phi.AAC.3
MGAASSTRSVNMVEPKPWRPKGTKEEEKRSKDVFIIQERLRYCVISPNHDADVTQTAGKGSHASQRHHVRNDDGGDDP